MTSTTRTKPQPPAAAVAADAHWAAKMDRLRSRALAETVFVVCDDQSVRDRYLRAQRDYDLAAQYAKANPKDTEAASDLTRATEARDDAKQAYDEVSIPIRFRALPRQALEALYEQHAPSETDTEDGKRWADSFPAALIAAACVDGMTETEAQELLNSWSLAEADAMFNAAYGVQNTTRTDLGKG
ncbi:hypothetical protein D0Z67_29055 (plasmid) [Streptomyces seoulensis]|uniref:Uncharacterized protein n=1 Tax=Streptomyces seoulensis TaxID=73044 RepID=A0A4P6U5A6_STRSO|nr:hypothetical protein [Streptomyces seoulensis]QBJ94421.1 hypothetical protein D0Z67_29055 [Streptomyces seoulensis]